MRKAVLVLAAALLLGACSSDDDTPAGGGTGGAGGGGRGGSTGTGGAPAGTGGATSGSGGSGGSDSGGMPAGTGGSTAGTGGASVDAASSDGTGSDGSAPDQAGEAGNSAAGNKAILIVGAKPLVRADIQLHDQLVASGLEVEDVLDGMSSTAGAEGKRLVVISYSIESANVRGKFNDMKVPVMVLEHVLLEGLGMTSASGHGWLHDVSQVTIAAGATSPLAAGLTGDVTVFTSPGGVFWGDPAPSAIKIATAKGTNRTVLFGYEAGAMMVSKPAPAKRLLFFLGAHLDNAPALSADGIKLLRAAIAWSIN